MTEPQSDAPIPNAIKGMPRLLFGFDKGVSRLPIIFLKPDNFFFLLNQSNILRFAIVT